MKIKANMAKETLGLENGQGKGIKEKELLQMLYI
jgi:hypothetical protein